MLYPFLHPNDRIGEVLYTTREDSSTSHKNVVAEIMNAVIRACILNIDLTGDTI
jgi:hypothetical protein